MYRVRTLSNTHGKHPPLWPAAMYACGFAFAWHTQEYYPAILFTIAAVMASLSFVTLWNWMIAWAIYYRNELHRFEPENEQVRLFEAVAKMTDNQVWLVAYSMGYKLEPDEPPAPVIETDDGTVEKSFAISQIDRAARAGGYLQPVREFAEGTPARDQRKALETHLVKLGLATPAAGNKPARVTDYQTARRRILE